MNTTQIIKNNQNATLLANQLKKSNDLYKELTKEEERQMIEQNRSNRDQLNQLLVNHNIKMVYSLAKKYSTKVNDFDNLIQDGIRGLSEAATKFELDAGVKFITYAVPWILKYMKLHFYRKNIEVDKNSISLNSVVVNSSKSQEDSTTTLENYVNDYVDPSIQQTTTITSELSSHEQDKICKDLYSILDHDTSLSSTDKQIFKDLFQNKEKTRTLAVKYNVDTKDIASIKNKVLTKFKNILKNEYKIQSFYDIYEK